MNELIQKQSDEIAVIVYDAPRPPKYFRLTKRFVKMLFVVFPVLTLLVFSTLIIWGLGLRLKEVPTPKIPVVLNESETKIRNLENEIKDLKQSNQEMIDKIASASPVSGTGEPSLLMIKRPYGMQNLINQNNVTLDQIQFQQSGKKVSLRFQIISATPDNRVTGHILVFMLSDSGLLAYPKEANDMLLQGIKYSVGETFAVSRLRPTNAEFNQIPMGKDVKFIIYIFNREGDLLLLKETESFKLETKS